MIWKLFLKRLNIPIISFLFLVANGSILYAQSIDHFYHSDYCPQELNRSSSERIKNIYEDYRLKGRKGLSKKEEKEFVYEYNFFLDRLNRSGKVFYGDEITKYLNDLKDFIISDGDLKKRIRVYLVDYPSVNAFTNDFGNIYMNVASIATLDSEEELVFMLAHEIAHVILEHSYKKESFISDVDEEKLALNEKNKTFLYHQFSQKNELQADSLALFLLKNKISKQSGKDLMQKLKYSNNPVVKRTIDFDLFLDPSIKGQNILHNLWNSIKADSLAVDTVEVVEKETTHPSIEKRIAFIDNNSKLIQDTTASMIYLTLDSFSVYKRLATQLLVNTYVESNELLKALQLVLSLRKSNREDMRLIEKQSQIITLLAQLKYKDEIESNPYGNSCDNRDFLKLRQFIHDLSEIDLNLIAIYFNDFYSEKFKETQTFSAAYKYSYQLLYKENKEIMSDLDERRLASEEYEESVSDSNYLLSDYHLNHKIDFRHLEIIEEYKNKVNSKNSFSKDDFRIDYHPEFASYEFGKGKTYKSDVFKADGKSILFQSYNFYLKSKSRKKFTIDYEKTLELEEFMAQIREPYNTYYKNVSTIKVNKITVSDHYLQKIAQIWIADQLSGDGAVYSRVENQFKELVLKKDVDYLVFNVCFVNKNKRWGNKNNLVYYEFYLDVKNGGIAYHSKIGSKHNPDKYQLEHLIYWSNLMKEKND